jgi:DNA-binding beta-propeller fold protein YncE
VRSIGVIAVAAAAAAFVAAVAWPVVAGLGLLSGGGEVPPTFDGPAVAWTTAGWSAALAFAATVAGWPVGRAIRRARGGHALLAASVLAAALPPYAVFWSWWQAAGPGSWLGDWCAVRGLTGLLRESLLAVGLVSWAWPIGAWFVAARPPDERLERELGRVDGERAADRLARAWRTDRAALALAFAVTAFVLSGMTAAFDLAQVRTFGFELRTLDVQGVPAGAVLRAAWPAIAVAMAGAVLLACRRVRPREAGATEGRWSGARVAWIVVALTVLVPAAALAVAIVGRASLDRFLETSVRGTMGTFATAAAAGAVIGVVAVGHLVLAAAGRSGGPGARWARLAEHTMLAGWIFAAAVPATVLALCLVSAWNGPVLGPVVYDTPAIVALCHLGRFGFVGAWLGRMPALREPAERRDLRAVDGVGVAGTVAALAPEARGAWLAAATCGTALAAGEVIASARLEPPGWAWSASTLLNAIHYQQPSTVLGGLLAVLVVAGGAGVAVSWLLARAERVRGAALVLLALLPVMVGGCREAALPPGAVAVEATRWFGAAGRGRGQFEYPRALDIDPRDGSVLVIDRRARVQRFTPEGRYVSEWTMPEQALGKPTGFGIGPDGRVWVADTHYHRVICYAPDGTELRRIGSYGTGPGQFIYPCDAEIGPDGNLWVAEFGGNDRIQVFSADGTFLRSIGRNGPAPGEFDRPQSIGFSADGTELVVSDACNHRVQVLSLDGTPRRAFGTAGSGPGQLAYPYGLEVLPDGTALVTEFGNHRLQWLDLRDGRSLGIARRVDRAPVPTVLHVIDGDRVRSLPSGENALRFPWAVGVRDGEAFILDSGHSRVLAAPLASLRAAAPVDGRSSSVVPAP